jgi:hypothetical protein
MRSDSVSRTLTPNQEILMKALAFALLFTMSVPAMANICTLSWNDVGNSRYTAQFPKIKMDSISKDQVGTTFVSVDGLCIDGDRLQTRKAQPVCLQMANDEAGTCADSRNAVLSTDISYVAEIAVGESSRFEKVPSTHPTKYMIPVGTDGDVFHTVCEKEFAIPQCTEKKRTN